MKSTRFVGENKVISCVEEKIFDAQGDAYLSDALSLTSAYSTPMTSVEEKIKRAFLRKSFFDATGYAYVSDPTGHTSLSCHVARR